MLGIPRDVAEHALRLILGSKPAKQCEHFGLATTVINSSELPWLGESSTPAVLDCNKPTSSMAFRPLDETKAVGIDPTDPINTVWIGTKLPAK